MEVGRKYRLLGSGDILELKLRQKTGKDFLLTFKDENGNPHKIKESIIESLNLMEIDELKKKFNSLI